MSAWSNPEEGGHARAMYNVMIKRQSKSLSKMLAGSAGLLLLCSLGVRANQCEELANMPTSLEVIPGTHEEIVLPVVAERLAVGNQDVADVKLIEQDTILLTAQASGITNLSVWTACDEKARQMMVFVQGEATQALTGAAPEAASEEVVPNQVQTEIRFVEVNRSKLQEVGLSLLGTASNNFLFSSPGTAPGSVPVGDVGSVSPQLPLADDGFNIVWGGGSSKVLAALNALENSGFAYTLARPSLVAMSGQSASFLAGGEFPVPVPSSASNNISIQYKEFGVRLNLTPTVVSENRIVLKVAPEVSELDFNSGVSVAGTMVPALRVRRTDTSVSLANGESFVISGLINTSNQGMVDKLPGLGDIPVLGAFFRSSRIEREERELMMVVTPHLVQPLAAGAALPELPGEGLRNYSPSSLELLLLETGEFDETPGLSR